MPDRIAARRRKLFLIPVRVSLRACLDLRAGHWLSFGLFGFSAEFDRARNGFAFRFAGRRLYWRFLTRWDFPGVVRVAHLTIRRFPLKSHPMFVTAKFAVREAPKRSER